MIAPDGTSAATARVNELVFAGTTGAWDGQLDLTNNAMVIDYNGASPFALIADQVKSGFNSGAWNGQGIISSIAAATPNRAVGFVEASEIGSPASFLGQPSDGTSVLLRFTLPGDSNLDATVNISDFALLAANFNTASTWLRGDYNYDGVTGIGDFALLAANFNRSLPASLPRGVVPEPSLGVATLIAAGALIRRRSSKAQKSA
jgi:hypothetical protein